MSVKLLVLLVGAAVLLGLAVVAVLLLCGHAQRIAAAFNPAPKQRRNTVNQRALSRFWGGILLALTGCVLLLFAGAWLCQIWMMTAGVAAAVAVAGVALFRGTSEQNFQNEKKP